MNRRVVIVGGGVAGLEALLALHDLAGDRAELTLVAPDPDFLYKPLLVEEPFDLGPAEQHALAPLAEELGARFVQKAAKSVQPDEHTLELDDGSTLDYDFLIVCAGGRFHPALERARTFPSGGEPLRINELLRGGRGTAADRLRGAVRRHLGAADLRDRPDDATQGPRARGRRRRADHRHARGGSARHLRAGGQRGGRGAPRRARDRGRGRRACPRGRRRRADPDARETGESRRRRWSPCRRWTGRRSPACPQDEGGFIPIDEHARVAGVEDVYAAGDGTNFPIKQGGLGTQQADAAAAHIAERLGAAIAVEPFHPVLRGKLITGDESLHLRADVAGGGGEGEASLDCLWWPPHKISGRYLAPFLYHGDVHAEPEPPRRSLDVEVALPTEWHEEPMALDPYGSPRID